MQTNTAHYRLSANLLSSTQVHFGRRDLDAPGLHLVRISRERWQPHFHIKRNASPGLGILLVCDGQGRYVGNSAEALATGSLIIVRPNAFLQIDNDPAHTLEFLMVYLGGQGIHRLLREECPALPSCLRPANAHAVRRAFEHCFASGLEGGPEAESICIQLVRVLLRTVRNGLGDRHRPSQGQDCFFACKALIDSRFRELNKVEDIATTAGISRAYLDRLFRLHLACTPRDYLIDTKLHYAAHRLQVGDEPIRALASELGYADQYGFSRAFKRRFGQAPSHYRLG